MDFKAQGEPITLETPLPRPAPSRASSAAGPSSAPIEPPESTTSTEIPPSGPSTQSQSTPSSAPDSRYPDVLTLLPLFSLTPSHRLSLREALPLLQNSLLGMVNDNIRSHNETRDALCRFLGQPPMPHRPLYTSPYATSTVASPRSTTTTSATTTTTPTTTPPTPPPPPPSSSTAPPVSPRVVRFDDTPHIITTADLSRAFDAISLPTVDSELADISEILKDLARTSRSVGSTEDLSTVSGAELVPTSALSLPTTLALAPVFTQSDIVSTELAPLQIESDPVPLIQPADTPLLDYTSSSTTAVVPYSDSAESS